MAICMANSRGRLLSRGMLLATEVVYIMDNLPPVILVRLSLGTRM